MKVVVIGCGRAGSAVARRLSGEGADVSVVDEAVEAFDRLGSDFSGERFEGHALDLPLLMAAGIAEADACVVSTDGDNTNLLIGQVIKRKWSTPRVIVRILDPRRAEFYASHGVEVVSPTAASVESMVAAVSGPGPIAADSPNEDI